LLSLARQQAAVTAHQPVDLAAIARLVVEDLYPLAEQKKLDFGLELQGEVWVEGTEAALHSLIRNAVDNALRYSPENGEVTIRIRSDGDEGIVEVIDSGPGIPPEESHRVFDAFYRLPDSAEGGSGLGLTIARHIADQLGGRITLGARSGRQGLVFLYRQRLAPPP
jgi:two-component system OmpR family sensor kinase/two-component system sensor histidine kinase QseC